jgi:hypothetical protein
MVIKTIEEPEKNLRYLYALIIKNTVVREERVISVYADNKQYGHQSRMHHILMC